MALISTSGVVLELAETSFPVTGGLSWVEVPGGLSIRPYAWRWTGSAFEQVSAVPPPETIPAERFRAKSVLVRKLTDEEAAQLLQAQQLLPAKARLLWEAAHENLVDVNDPLLRGFLTSVLGATRAAQVLDD